MQCAIIRKRNCAIFKRLQARARLHMLSRSFLCCAKTDDFIQPFRIIEVNGHSNFMLRVDMSEAQSNLFPKISALKSINFAIPRTLGKIIVQNRNN